MKAYTDYPEAPEFAHQKRPMRLINVISYYHDKYVQIKEYPYSVKRVKHIKPPY